MGVYYMLVNHKLKEYIAWKHANMSIKSWVHTTHGLFVTWVLQRSRWYNTPCQLMSDAGTEDQYNNIYFDKAGYKDVEIEMIEGFNKYIKDYEYPSEHMITIEEKKEGQN